MELRIKNMVCPRCIMAVTDLLTRRGLTPTAVALGRVVLREELPAAALADLDTALRAIGFEIAGSEADRTVHAVKQTILDALRRGRPFDAALRRDICRAVADTVTSSAAPLPDFAAIARTFAAAEGRTPEKYYLAQRIERVKELLEDADVTMKEIAWQTGFSGVAHLSRQFKQLTGLTPTAYRAAGLSLRLGRDKA